MGAAGGKRDAARAGGNGRRRPARQPAQLGPAKVWFLTLALVPIAMVATFVRRRLARGSVAGLVVQLGGPTEPADLRAALARALGDPSLDLAYWFPAEARYVTGGRPPGRGPGRRQRTALDARRTRRDADRDAAARSRARAQLGTRPVGMRRRGPRARERAAPGGVAGAAGRAEQRHGGGWSRRPTPSAAGSSATFTTGRSSGWSRSRCRSGCSSPSWPRTRATRRRSCARRGPR